MKKSSAVFTVLLWIMTMCLAASCTMTEAEGVNSLDLASSSAIAAEFGDAVSPDADITLADFEDIVAKAKEAYNAADVVKLSEGRDAAAVRDVSHITSEYVSTLTEETYAADYENFVRYQEDIYTVIMQMLMQRADEDAYVYRTFSPTMSIAPPQAHFAVDMEETGCDSLDESMEKGRYLEMSQAYIYYVDTAAGTSTLVFPTPEDQQIIDQFRMIGGGK